MSQHLLKVSRLEGLTDGIFAIAMTILVLELHLPRGLTSDHLSYLLKSEVLFNLTVYIGSFIILGTLWIAMNFQLGLLEKVNRLYLWTNVFYLMVVCIIPFSASLVTAYPTSRSSTSFFAINLLCTSIGQVLTFQAAHYFKLNNNMYTAAIRRAVIKRILVGPIFYLSSLVIAPWDTGLAFLLLVAPPIIYIFPGNIDKYDDGT